MPVFVTFLRTKWIQSSVATIYNAKLFSSFNDCFIHSYTRVTGDVQLPTKFANKGDPKSTDVMASNTDNFVGGEREGLIAKICWCQTLE